MKRRLLQAGFASLALLALVVNVPGAIVLPATTLVSTGPTGGNGAFAARAVRVSTDGSRVFFETAERLVSADTDGSDDVYLRTGGTTSLVSIGPAGGSGAFDADLRGTSADGSRVFFETNEQLVSADRDTSRDVYERSGGTTTLVSIGLIGGSGSAAFRGASADGSHVFFETTERIVSADTDTARDVYDRHGGATTLVSTGPSGGNGAFGASFESVSAGGARVFFTTAERLVSADTDAQTDIYRRSVGTTTLISTGPYRDPRSSELSFEGTSSDGFRVFFQTDERLVTADRDGLVDVYMRAGETTTLVSAGMGGRGSGPFRSFFRGSSTDGSRVFFVTADALVSADEADESADVYQRSGDTTTLLSTGPAGGNGAFPADFAGASADGSRVFFHTGESLVEADQDQDDASDVYQRSGGTTTLVSTGPSFQSGHFSAFLWGVSASGSRAYFTTAEQLVSTDEDAQIDVYMRSGSTTTLVSTGSAGGNGSFASSFAGASADGSRAFFTTAERLAGGDTDSQQDVYQRTALSITG